MVNRGGIYQGPDGELSGDGRKTETETKRVSEHWEVRSVTGGDYVVVEVSSRRVVPALYSIELAAWLRASQNNLPGLRLLPSYHTESDIRKRLEAWLIERFNYREEEFGPYWAPGYELLRSMCLRVRYCDAVDLRANEEARTKVREALAEFAEWQEIDRRAEADRAQGTAEI